MTIEAESEDELIADILDKARCGGKVIPLAISSGIPPEMVFHAAIEEGIRLKRGRPNIRPMNGGSPREYRRHLDQRYWAGFAEDFLRDAQTAPLDDLAQRPKYRRHGLRTRQRLYEIYADLTAGRPKPDPQYRRDITKTRLEKLARRKKCKSAEAIARHLNTTSQTVQHHAAKWGIKLPNATAAKRARANKLMPQIKILRGQGWTVSEIAEKCGIHHHTVLLWNRRSGYALWRPSHRN